MINEQAPSKITNDLIPTEFPGIPTSEYLVKEYQAQCAAEYEVLAAEGGK